MADYIYVKPKFFITNKFILKEDGMFTGNHEKEKMAVEILCRVFGVPLRFNFNSTPVSKGTLTNEDLKKFEENVMNGVTSGYDVELQKFRW